ncbi:MAG: hypothetical protein F6K36_20085 [Symploca sp. SIO3C6]|nr:hypothetical protein [Symploca sp. SIO3C6]
MNDEPLTINKRRKRYFPLLKISLPLLFSFSLVIASCLHSQVASSAPTIHVTGQPLSVNGTTEVPVGLFGVHATPLTPKQQQEWGIESVRVIQPQPNSKPLLPGNHQSIPATVQMIVECFYDRYRPALILSQPNNWQRILSELGSNYGKASLNTGQVHHVEFWNEPYLNWAAKPGVNYDGRFYDQSNVAKGARVRIRNQQEFTEHLVWRRGLWVLPADSNQPNYVAARYRPQGVGVGQSYQWRDRTYRVIETWLARDTTQTHWFSGQQNRIFYEEMLAVFGKALKAANPKVQLVAGWGFHIHQDGWEGWRQLYKPLVDNFHQLLDGLNEHHYGGDTRVVTADYETVTAYTDRTYGKRLHFYNTEAGGMLDPERPDSIRPRPEGSPLAQALGAMTYTLRDIVHVIDIAPDKAVARAAHEADKNGGDEYAFRLLRPLRGKLLYCTSPWSNLWCVASRNGNKMAVVLFNDSRGERQISLQVDAPNSNYFNGARRLSVHPRRDKQGLELVSNKLNLDKFSQKVSKFSQQLKLQGKSGTTLVFDIADGDNNTQTVTLTQHFAEGILMKVSPEQPLELSISLPSEELARADRTRLKVVLPDYNGQGTVDINGTTVALEEGKWTVRQDIDPSFLKTNTKLTFKTDEQAYGLWMVSIELIDTAVSGSM